VTSFHLTTQSRPKFRVFYSKSSPSSSSSSSSSEEALLSAGPDDTLAIKRTDYRRTTKLAKAMTWGALDAGNGWCYIFNGSTQHKLGINAQRPGALVLARRGSGDEFRWRAETVPMTEERQSAAALLSPPPPKPAPAAAAADGKNENPGRDRKDSKEEEEEKEEKEDDCGAVCYLVNKASRQRLCLGLHNRGNAYALWGSSARFQWLVRRVPPELPRATSPLSSVPVAGGQQGGGRRGRADDVKGEGGGVTEGGEVERSNAVEFSLQQLEARLLQMKGTKMAFQCPCCLHEAGRLHGLRLRCGHALCIDCLYSYVPMLLKKTNRPPLPCPKKGCGVLLTPVDLFYVLEPEQVLCGTLLR